MKTRIVRGPILRPRLSGAVEFLPDGAMQIDAAGNFEFVGPWAQLAAQPGAASLPVEASRSLITPPFLDAHIHIPQHPIRGRFLEGVPAAVEGSRLLAGLERNVFPAEGRAAEESYAEQVVRQFALDTLAHGVVGGAAYMTVHAAATETALRLLPSAWSVGLVLMNQNCPDYLRTSEESLDTDVARLAAEYGRRLILTDRFAVSVDAPLRRHAAQLAARYGLRMQTHLNEQRGEKQLVEKLLYPDCGSYTEVYLRDGLLDHEAILAHCIHMSDREFQIVRDAGAAIAHCPVSNTLLGSGIMRLDAVSAYGIDYALCTDVGASPTTSLLCEMAQFLIVHSSRSTVATPSEALYRTTLAPARILGLEAEYGLLEAGRPASYLEIEHSLSDLASLSADEAILQGLLSSHPTRSSALPSLAPRPPIPGEQLAETGNVPPELGARGPSMLPSPKEPKRLSRRGAGGEVRELDADLKDLERGELDQNGGLARLTQEVETLAQKLDRKVLRVTLKGKTVWERGGAEPVLKAVRQEL